MAKAPDFEAKGQTKCSTKASQSEPLIVEWPSAARGQLESIIESRRAVAVVRYEGCEMRVLAGCRAPGKLAYVAFRNQKQDSVHIRNTDDLYASLPVGAGALEAKLERAGELTVDVVLVGRYESDTDGATLADLHGQCAGATHIIRAVTVGAFDFHTGASASAAGGVKVGPIAAGGASSSGQETLAKDGSTLACEKAGGTDTEPPMNCGALVRIEVLPLGVAAQASVENPTTPAASVTATSETPTRETPTLMLDFVASADSDGDGIVDGKDACVHVPEDIDGYLDDDGCPDLDNDADAVVDVNDKCPNYPEDPDGFEDEDGCPETDNDKDGILDTADECPNRPGPAGGPHPGCPTKRASTNGGNVDDQAVARSSR